MMHKAIPKVQIHMWDGEKGEKIEEHEGAGS